MLNEKQFDSLIIWWLSPEDIKYLPYIAEGSEESKIVRAGFRIGRTFINDEVQSLEGRNGRGRLWVNRYIEILYGEVNVSEAFEENKKYLVTYDKEGFHEYRNYCLIRYISEKCGGIVVEKADYECIRYLPGIITDTQLDRWPYLDYLE